MQTKAFLFGVNAKPTKTCTVAEAYYAHFEKKKERKTVFIMFYQHFFLLEQYISPFYSAVL